MGDLIGVVTAMQEEMEPFIEELNNLSKRGRLFYGDAPGVEFVGIVSGCGKIKAASATQYLIDLNYNLSHIVHFGAAGSLDDSLRAWDIVIPNMIVEYDVEIKLIPNPKNRVVEIKNEYADFIKKWIKHREGIVISGDRDVADSKTRKRLREKYHALTTDWESYAVAKVCEINSVPCVVLRGVTDNADSSAPQSFKKNLYRVSKNLADKILAIYSSPFS